MGGISGQGGTHACACVGPQNGDPYCPCRMRWRNPPSLPNIPLPGTPDPTTTQRAVRDLISPTPKGWECPRCSRVWGPRVGACSPCNQGLD